MQKLNIRERKINMNKQNILKILNPIMFILIIIVLIGLLLYKSPLFPSLRGTEQAAEVHEVAGGLFILLAIVHISLNWNWIKTQVFGIKPKPKSKEIPKK